MILRRESKKGMKWIALLFAVMIAPVACGDGGGGTQPEAPSGKSANKLNGVIRVSATELQAELKFKATDYTVSNFVVLEYGTKNAVPITSIKGDAKGKTYSILTAKPMPMSKNFLLGVISEDEKKDKMVTNFGEGQLSDDFLNKFYSDKAMGCTVSGGKTTFRVFAPRAVKVILCMFDKPYTDDVDKPLQEGEKQIEMTMDKDGVWEASVNGELWGKYYGYRVAGPDGASEEFDANVIVADPYSKAMATKQMAPQHHLTVIIDTSKYSWKSAKKYAGFKQEQYILYEMNVRDLTMLSKDVKNKGTYDGLVEDGKQGGLAHIKELGVNAVELLPTQEFNEIEAPYMTKSKTFAYNTWNTYGRNHWGYMTANFFSPEAFYYEGKIKENAWIGASGEQVFAFKRMVDIFHQNGIAVVMDVVYNHVSQYDKNALKLIDKKYYFWMTPLGTYDAHSGCGNDYKSSRPMSSKLIVDSCAYWIAEYRVDGYRFDLGTIIDWNTYEKIKKAVYKLNPETFLVAEPWMGGRGEPLDGGGYSPQGMAKHGIAAWNDKVREQIKSLAQGQAGTPGLEDGVKGMPGTYIAPKYSLSYFGSHDNNTLADYLRKNQGGFKESMEIMPAEYIKVATLDEKLMKMNKIAALYLYTIQGPVMIEEGTEIARMKVVFPPSGESVFPPNSAQWEKTGNKWGNKLQQDTKGNPVGWSSKAYPWRIDHDSYEKDNECNWINWELKTVNNDLFQYHKGLIAIRKMYSKTFGLYPIDKIKFIKAMVKKGDKPAPNTKATVGYFYDKAASGDSKSFVVLVNGDIKNDSFFTLPAGEWTVLVDAKSSIKPEAKKYTGDVTVPSGTGMILVQ
jgi:pullulanase/glycogen debranching enzyme